jgi:hypothetical protein
MSGKCFNETIESFYWFTDIQKYEYDFIGHDQIRSILKFPESRMEIR